MFMRSQWLGFNQKHSGLHTKPKC